MWPKIKVFLVSQRDTILTALIIILVGFGAYRLGQMSIAYQGGSDFKVISTPAENLP